MGNTYLLGLQLFVFLNFRSLGSHKRCCCLVQKVSGPQNTSLISVFEL